MTLSRVIKIILLLGILGMATHFAIDSDTWWHLRAGEWMIENQTLIESDPFSHTRAGTAWQYPGMWVQVWMAWIYGWVGPAGLNLWAAALVAVIFWLVYESSRGSAISTSVMVLLAAIGSAIYWAARPYLVSFLIFAIGYLILERYWGGRTKNVWLMPVLMIVWVNTHGGFLAGFLLVLPYLVEAGLGWLSREEGASLRLASRRLAHLIQVGLLMGAASLLNPQGLGIWSLPFTTVARQAEQLLIAEWQSPNFHDPTLLPFGILIALGMGLPGISGRRLAVREALLLGGFGLLGLISVRNIFFFVIAAVPILAVHLDGAASVIAKQAGIRARLDFERPPTGIQRMLNWVLVAVATLAVAGRIGAYLPQQANMADLASRFPVQAVAFARERQPEGNLFNSYNFGGYLVWALEEFPVFADGRADLYGDEILLPLYRVTNGSPEWRDLFELYEIGWVMVKPEELLAVNLERAGWKVVYEDPVAVILLAP